MLNAANVGESAANLAGFRVEASGTLHSIPGAIRPLSTAHPNPAQVLLDPQRHTLLVTEKGTNMIDVYQVGLIVADAFGGPMGPAQSPPTTWLTGSSNSRDPCPTVRSRLAGWLSQPTGHISTIAKCTPMQLRGPSPNGMYARRPRSPRSGAKRSGSNIAGLSQKSGYR